jgi:hypothetical protein
MDWEPVPGDAEAFQADAMEWEPCPGPTSGSHPFVEASVDTMDWEPVPGDAEALEAEPMEIVVNGMFYLCFSFVLFHRRVTH